jgi:hypothetical protein
VFISRLVSLKLDECVLLSNETISLVFRLCTSLQNLSLCFCRQLDDNALNDVGSQNFTLTSLGIAGCGSFTDLAIEKIAKFCHKLKDISK